MTTGDKRACAVSGGLSIVVLVALGFLLAYPVMWIYESIRVQKREVGDVEFYGHVSDPEGNPISDVKIEAELTTYKILGGTSKQEIQAVSDETGAFSFGPTRGISLVIHKLTKKGYSVRGRNWPSEGGRFWTFHFSTNGMRPPSFDEDHPFTFTMDPDNRP